VHSVPVFANDSLLQMLRWLQRFDLRSSRSSKWMLFFKGISDVLRNRLNFLIRAPREIAKSATHIKIRSRQKIPFFIRVFPAGTLLRAIWGQIRHGAGRGNIAGLLLGGRPGVSANARSLRLHRPAPLARRLLKHAWTTKNPCPCPDCPRLDLAHSGPRRRSGEQRD
jgi:hypothetical protein